jgi:putative transcriptional regulator
MCTVSTERPDHLPSFPVRRLEPAPGRLLIAAPLLTEDTFKRTVVYLLEHDGAGTVGVVINRPSRTPVGQVLPLWQDVVSEPSVVFGGGPVLVDGALCLGQVGGDEVAGDEVGEDESSVRRLTDGLATVDLDGDVALITGMTTQLRIFAGHAGWSAGQLDGELAQGAWFVVPGSAADVFSDEPRTLWSRVLRRQPPPLSLVATYPPDPSLN